MQNIFCHLTVAPATSEVTSKLMCQNPSITPPTLLLPIISAATLPPLLFDEDLRPLRRRDPRRGAVPRRAREHERRLPRRQRRPAGRALRHRLRRQGLRVLRHLEPRDRHALRPEHVARPGQQPRPRRDRRAVQGQGHRCGGVRAGPGAPPPASCALSLSLAPSLSLTRAPSLPPSATAPRRCW